MPFGFGNSAPAQADTSQAAPADPFKPSALDVALGVLFNGGSPADEAMKLRNQKASLMMNQYMMGLVRDAGQDDSAPLAQPSAPAAPPAQTSLAMPATGGADQGPIVGAPPMGDASQQVPSHFRKVQRLAQAMAIVNPKGADALTNVLKLGEVGIGANGEAYGKYDPRVVGRNFSASQYTNGVLANPNSPNAPRYIPTAPVEGAEPLYDRYGNIVDWRVPQGAEHALDIKNKAAIMRGTAAMADAVTGRINSGTQAAAQANTASQNAVAPPPGFTVRPRRR